MSNITHGIFHIMCDVKNLVGVVYNNLWQRIMIPEARDDNIEVVFANMRTRIDNATDDYIRKNCDIKGNIKDSNIDKEEAAAIRSVKKKVSNGEVIEKRKKDGEVVITITMSSKLCIMKKEDYVELGKEHVEKDIEIGREEVLKRERILKWSMMWE